MIIRTAFVVVLIMLAGLIAWSWERRQRTASGLNSGITVFTAPDCRLCPLALAAVAKSTVRVTIVDVRDVADRSIRSVPTAMVADRSGKLLASRSGRSAVTDMPTLINMAEAFA